MKSKRPKDVALRRVKVLQAIKNFMTNNNGLPPTRRDILKGSDITSLSVLNHHLGWLDRQGYINSIPEIARGITGVTDDGEEFIRETLEGE